MSNIEPKRELFNEVWFLYKKYLGGNGSDEYWINLKKDAESILYKYNKDSFARELINSVLNELEHTLQNKTKEEK